MAAFHHSYLIFPEGVFLHVYIFLINSRVDMPFQVLHVLGYCVGVVASGLQIIFECSDELESRFGERDVLLEVLQQGQSRQMVPLGAFLQVGSHYFMLQKRNEQGLVFLFLFIIQGIFQNLEGNRLPLLPELQFLSFYHGHKIIDQLIQCLCIGMILDQQPFPVPLVGAQVNSGREIFLLFVQVSLDLH